MIRGLLGAREPEAYRCTLPGVKRPLHILGPYLGPIGGCDRIRPYANILTLLDKYAPRGHVMFEGVLISDNYGQIGEWLEKRGKQAVVAFLDTPLETCLERLNARTENPGNQHVGKKYQAIKKVRGWFLENGKVRVVDISSDTGADTLLKLLQEDGQTN